MGNETAKCQAELASDEKAVSALYQNSAVADKYMQARFVLAWQRLLHETQVQFLRQSIQLFKPDNILEIAPGPARLSTELVEIRNGTMLENSQEMINVARVRLQECELLDRWIVVQGNAFESKDCPGPFDFIYTFRFIRHFDEEHRMRLYAAIHSRLKPHGILMFDVVNSTYNIQGQPSSAAKQSGALAVFDAGYTVQQFHAEMNTAGFEVLSMYPAVRHFRLQSWISSKLYDRAPDSSRSFVRILEAIPSRSPLEWIAICRSMDRRG